MNNTLKVLRLFADNKSSKFSIKKASERLKINYRIVYEEIIKLEKEGLIGIEKFGNSKICRFKHKFCSKAVEIEDIKKNELMENKDIKLIHKRLAEIKSPFYMLLVFGSYADKTNTKHSDIDLCLITNNKEISKKAKDILSITPINIHFLDFTSEQFASMLKTKEDNVGHEIVNNSIILHGIEGFYEMVNNAH